MVNNKKRKKADKLTIKKKMSKSSADEFIDFVVMFNRFINHKPKEKVPMIGRDMRM
ncbi:MAG: hypothetical protein ABIH71_07480 [Candidatus Omnitrophota bacterium]|nr:hypothetical protein [Candidatus Omnitrophota bacterium]